MRDLFKFIPLIALFTSPVILAADYTCSASGGTNCTIAIPDLGTASSIIVPPNACPTGIADVDVNIDLSHTWVGDLLINLTAPSGQVSTLIDLPGVPATGLGCSQNNILATFDDSSSTPAENECAGAPPAIAGTVSPSTPLSSLNTSSVAGNWTLTMNDQTLFDTGQLNDWTLSIECNPQATNIPVFGPFGLLAMLGGLFWFGGRCKKQEDVC